MNPLAHEEIQELLGAYALHAVEPEEAEQIARHLEQCPRCRSEVSGHREVATLLGNSGGDAPDGLWDRIASQLEEAPPPLRLSIPPASSAEVVPVAPRRRERSGRVVLAAVGAAAAIVIGVLGAQVVRQDSRIGELEAALDGSSMSDASVATLSSPDGSVSAEVVVLANGTAYLLARDLPGLAPDHTYQLWGVTSHGAVSLGLLGAEPGAVMPFQVGDAEQMSALAVTEEVAGGVERSEHQPVLVGELG